MGTVKAQASVEYLIAYAITFLLFGVVVYMITGAIAPNYSVILPERCSFDIGLNCKLVVIASNSTNTAIAVLATNARPYALKNPMISLTANTSNAVACSATTVNPGQLMFCVTTLPTLNRVDAPVTGGVVISAQYCGLSRPNCAAPDTESFLGNYTTTARKMLQPGVKLSSATGSYVSGSTAPIQLSITLNVFGYSINASSASLVSSSPTIKIVSSSPPTVTRNGTTGFGTITISYGGLKTNVSVAFIPQYARAIITNFGSGTLTDFDTYTQTSNTISGVSNPFSIAVTRNNENAYIAQSTLNKVTVLSLLNYTVLRTINVGKAPIDVAIDPQNNYAYVANLGSKNISIINTQGNMPLGSINLGLYPAFLNVSRDGSRVFATNQISTTIVMINTATNSTTNLVVNSVPDGIASSPDSGTLYATLPLQLREEAYNIQTGTATYFGTGYLPFAIVANPSTNAIYVSYSSWVGQGVLVFDATTYALKKTVNVGFTPLFMAVSPGGASLYMLNAGSNSFSIMNATTYTVTGPFSTGTTPTWIAFQT